MPTPPRDTRAAFALSIGLVLLGSAGVTFGVWSLDAPVIPESEPPPGLPPAAAAAAIRWNDAMMRVLLDDPHRPALGLLNLIVSGMLVFGSFVVSSRRESAAWWVKNAVAANVVFMLVDAGHVLARFGWYRRGLVDALVPYLEASAVAAPDRPTEAVAGTFLGFVGALYAGWVLLKVLVHLWPAWKLRTEPVQAYLAAKDREP